MNKGTFHALMSWVSGFDPDKVRTEHRNKLEDAAQRNAAVADQARQTVRRQSTAINALIRYLDARQVQEAKAKGINQ